MQNPALTAFFTSCLLTALVACGRDEPAPAVPVPSGPEPAEIEVTARVETAPTARDGANDATLWLNRASPEQSLIIGSGDGGGIEFYALDGTRTGSYGEIESTLVELRDGFDLDGNSVTLLVADDRRNGSVHAFAVDGETHGLRPVSATPISAGFEITGLCLYRNPETLKDYAFIVGESGFIQQWELYGNGHGQVAARLIRTLGSGFGSSYCAADDIGGMIYLTEETVGIWRIEAEPETDGIRVPLDLASPFGRLGEEVKGIAIHRTGPQSGWLVASAAADNRFLIYDLAGGGFLGRFGVKDGAHGDAIEEAEGLHLDLNLATPAFPGGVLIAADDDNGDEATNYKLMSWQEIASATGLPPSTVNASGETRRAVANVQPAAETDPVHDAGDAADDPAIWVNPADPGQSLIIAAQKQRGLYVHDLEGRTLQVIEDGRMNNVDLRRGFSLGRGSIDLVAASNRNDNSISLYAVDAGRRRLSEMIASIPTGLGEIYGLCMYHSARTGTFHVFVNDTDGRMQQWQLAGDASGKVGYTRVREFRLDSQPEGCVADDELGHLYVGEEAVGVWKYSAEPDGGDGRKQVDTTTGGNLVADVEGMAIFYGTGGAGYLVVSCQGDNTYAIYRRDRDNAFAGHFRVVANAALGIDGASETDGLDVSSAALGERFPRGLFIAQDGRNVMPAEHQNFKIVGWDRIAAAMNLQ